MKLEMFFNRPYTATHSSYVMGELSFYRFIGSLPQVYNNEFEDWELAMNIPHNIRHVNDVMLELKRS